MKSDFLFGKALIEKRFGSLQNLKSQTEKNYQMEKKLKKEKKLNLSEKKKEVINKNSITEYTGADKLSELLLINNKNIFNSKEEQLDNFKCDFSAYDLSLSIPPRISYDNNFNSYYLLNNSLNNSNIDNYNVDNSYFNLLNNSYINNLLNNPKVDNNQQIDNNSNINNLLYNPKVDNNHKLDNLYDKSKEIYKKMESLFFNEWKKINYKFIFERNIEIWRQFWITCERSDVIVQIIDSRNPNFFINKDILKMYPNKKHVILSNKSDLTSTKIEIEDVEFVYYSALTNIQPVIDFINKLKNKTIGFIGYPNVGKSSTINAILNKKKVKVSQTPGKTKFIQTIHFSNDKILLDCPGLVFPKHSKTNLLLNGILNVDKIVDLKASLYEIINFIGIDKLSKFYNFEYLKSKNNLQDEINFINKLATYKNLSVLQAIKNIIKDLFNGNIQYEKIELQYKKDIDYDFDKKYY